MVLLLPMVLGSGKDGMGDKSSGRRIVGMESADATKCAGGQDNLESMVLVDHSTLCVTAV